MCEEEQKFDYCESLAFVYFPQQYIFFHGMLQYLRRSSALVRERVRGGGAARLLITTLCHSRDETLAHHYLRLISIASLQLLLTANKRSSENSSIGPGIFYRGGHGCVVLLNLYR